MTNKDGDNKWARDGFLPVPGLLTDQQLTLLREECQRLTTAEVARGYGIRNVLQKSPQIRDLAESLPSDPNLRPILGFATVPLRAILFDKLPGANWKVAWHQDLTVAVQRRVDTEGFGSWSVKEGVVHVQPPVAILEAMVTVRLHLDNCGSDNGPLRVLPGSHREGILAPEAIGKMSRTISEVVCEAKAGQYLVMKPLLLHASSPAKVPSHRRVLHVEYIPAGMLPEALL